ncbi:MAG: glycosyltransferase family 4 protein [Acidimicrobiales bacterium]
MLGAYGGVFAVSAAVTFGLTPLAWRLAGRIGAVVEPDERRVHLIATPTLGGLAMFAGVAASLLVASRVGLLADVFSTPEPRGLMLAAAVMLGVGMLDDLRDVSAPAKLAGQVLAGSVLALGGIGLFFFRVPFSGLLVLSSDLSFITTVIWVVAMANAVNLIDGLDGLAAGLVAIASGAFFFYALRLGQAGLLDPSNPAPLITAAVCGACVGFLPHNFHPARVFMGDSGALLLGLLMAAATISVGGRTADPFSGQTYFFFAPLIIPFVILGVPFVDTALAIARRARRRTALSQADKDHLHHRLLRQGHGPRRAVFILWAWTAVLSGVVLVPSYTNSGNALVPFALAALAIGLFTVLHPRQDEPGPDDPTEDEPGRDERENSGLGGEPAERAL